MLAGVDRAARRASSPSAWSRRGVLGIFALAYGCAGNASVRFSPGPPTPDAGPITTSDLKFDVDPGKACANGQGICVAPSQVVTFGIEATAGTTVDLSLQGNYADAALSVQQVTVSGTPAGVTLEAASTTAEFSIVASVAGGATGQSISLNVTVSQSGSATIEATPTYLGHRPDTELYATDFVLSTCAEITAEPPDASATPWTEGAMGAAIPLTVPAGERVAVDVRIGHYAFGCTDVDPLVPSAVTTVPVQVYDIPLALTLTNLNAVLSYAPPVTAAQNGWQAVGQAAVAGVEASFFASSGADGGDGNALLDAMRTAIVAPGDQAQFDQLRQSEGWDATATSWMSSHPPSLASRAAVWLTTAESTPIGPLTLHVGEEPSGETTAPVTVVSFGALTWVAAGITQPAPFKWTADANDTVHLSGTISFASTPFFAHQANLQAASSVSGATGVASAIAMGIDCNGLASSLVGSGVSYGSCAAPCTANLCSEALTLAWNTASAAAPGGSDLVNTSITASAPADVGDLAEPAYVQGGWLGSVSGPQVPAANGSATFPITGTLLATEPTP